MSGDYKTYDEEAEPFKVSHAFRVEGVKKGVCTPDGTLKSKLALYRGEEE